MAKEKKEKVEPKAEKKTEKKPAVKEGKTIKLTVEGQEVEGVITCTRKIDKTEPTSTYELLDPVAVEYVACF